MFDYIKKILGIDGSQYIERSRIEHRLELASLIVSELQELYRDGVKPNKDIILSLKSPEAKRINNAFTMSSKTKSKSAVMAIEENLDQLKTNIDGLYDRVKKEFPPKYHLDNLTAKQIVLQRSSDQVFFLADMMINFVYYILMMEKIGSLTLNEGMKKKVEETPVILARLYDAFSAKTVLTHVDETMDVLVTEDNEDIMIATYGARFDPLGTLKPTGLIYNPFFYIGLWKANRDVEFYKKSQGTMRMIRLRITQLKLQQQKESTAQIEKQLAYEENLLSELQADCDRIAKGILA